MLLAFCSPKGGCGTSVLAAGTALVLARDPDAAPVRLADFGGDQPGLFGLGAEPAHGLADWLAAPDTDADTLDRLGIEVAAGLAVVPSGAGSLGGPRAAALATALRELPGTTVVDAGHGRQRAARAAFEAADRAVLVVRPCYLALRAAVRSPLLAATTGIAFVAEPSRAIGSREVGEVLERSVLVQVPVRVSIARAVDAGVLPTRVPEALARAAERLLGRLVRPGREVDQ